MAALRTRLDRIRRCMASLGVTGGDLRLTAILLSLCAAGFLMTRWMLPAPRTVVIRADGREVACLPLDVDTVYAVSEGNVIEIRDGGVRMIRADCPDQVCVHTGRITETGQSIVCVPHRVVVTIRNS
ncbi:MAG: NusG domain II-containing protein [Clostridia bacterium]|jgi:hypothetical protein|nr:NusG domain II-containing protein [Clostridia bacterium]MBQ1555072.1 NusG domain II-containing protein [Clostridia bacterium]